MEAVRKSGASVMLVCNPETANSSLLRMIAHQAGVQVLGPMEKDRTHTMWVECAPDPEFGDYEVTWRKCPKCKLNHDEKPVLATGAFALPVANSIVLLPMNDSTIFLIKIPSRSGMLAFQRLIHLRFLTMMRLSKRIALRVA